MLDSPALNNNLSKILQATRTHKIRKESEKGDKEEFFKKVQEKLGEEENKEDEDVFYKSDEVKVESEGEKKNKNKNEENDKMNTVNNADTELPGSMGKSIDIKI